MLYRFLTVSLEDIKITGVTVFVLRAALSLCLILFIAACLGWLFSRNRGRMVLAAFIDRRTKSRTEINSWEVSLGRSPTCDIVFTDETVSRFHAVAARRGRGWVIFDTGSKSGVRVNGELIDRSARIYDGDTISLGLTSVVFCAPLFRRPAEKPQTAQAKPAAPAQQPKPAQQRTRYVPALTGLTEGYDMTVLLIGGDYILGRSSNCNIVIPALNVSRFHAEIVKNGNEWHIKDLHSRAGTKVNGMDVIGEEKLSNGDVITIGGIKYRFHAKYKV